MKLDMKPVLKAMLEGWCLMDNKAGFKGTDVPDEEKMAQACDGNLLDGQLLTAMSHWSNDILSLAAHYGLGVARQQPDGSLVYDDGTVDTLLLGGTLIVVDVPAPPSYYWHGGKWQI